LLNRLFRRKGVGDSNHDSGKNMSIGFSEDHLRLIALEKRIKYLEKRVRRLEEQYMRLFDIRR